MGLKNSHPLIFSKYFLAFGRPAKFANPKIPTESRRGGSVKMVKKTIVMLEIRLWDP